MDESRLEQEKRTAVERYADLRQRGHSRDTAVAFLAASTAFPLLATAGKHGTSAMRFHNLDNWAKRLRDGRSLRRDYRRGATPSLPGGAAFWSAFFCLYLNPSRASLTSAYQGAAKLSPPKGVPTLRQCKYIVGRRLDPVFTALCRGEPLPVADASPLTPPIATPHGSR